MLDKKIVDQLPRCMISLAKLPLRGNASVVENVDATLREMSLVVWPPVLHVLFVLEMSNDEGDGDFLVAEKIVEKLVILLRVNGKPAPSHAEHEQVYASTVG